MKSGVKTEFPRSAAKQKKYWRHRTTVRTSQDVTDAFRLS